MLHAETSVNADAIRDEWINRLNHLVSDIEAWARSLDWTARRIDKPMKDSLLGSYRAPGLLLQKEFTRILLDPISRTTPGSEGVADLYLMPALDDIASLYFYDDRWNVHYQLPNSELAATLREAQAKPLTKATLAEVLDEMVRNAS